MTNVVLIHGVGGRVPAAEWLTPLNTRLAGLNLPTIAEPADSVFVADYESAFVTPSDQVVPITYKPPANDKALLDLQLAYQARQKNLERTVRGLADSTSAGWSTVPLAVADPLAGLAETLISTKVTKYVTQPGVRNAAWQCVLDVMPQHGRVTIVAHSLGSVVAAGLIRRLPPSVTVDLLVTIGSPLSFDRYRVDSRIANDFPWGRLLSWVNIYSPEDGITGGRGLSGAIAQVVDVAADVDGSHDIAAYLSHPAAAAAIGILRNQEREPVSNPSGSAPALRIHDSWYPVLLDTAFTFQVSNALPSSQWKAHMRLELARKESASRAIADIDRRVQNRAHLISQVRSIGADISDPDLDNHPLAPGRYPSYTALTTGAADIVRGHWADPELVSFAVALMLQPLVPPFGIDVSTAHRSSGLERTLNRVRDRAGNISDQQFADAVTGAVKWAEKQMGDNSVPWGTILLASGVVLLAATGVGVVAAAPAGVAGAAVVTSTLATFGPGGALGGLLTLATLTGTATGLGAAGFTIDATKPGNGRSRAEIASSSGVDLAATDAATLTVTVTGMLAVIHAQRTLRFTSTDADVRFALEAAISVARAEHQLHKSIAANSEPAKQWGRKVNLLNRALNALEGLVGVSPQLDNLRTARAAIESGRWPKELAAPAEPDPGP